MSTQRLPGIDAMQVETSRLKTQVLVAGSEDGEPVMFLHGNLAAGTFWEEAMLALPRRFRAAAPDQRGYGLSDPQARIDATRGFGDWVADAVALADYFGWDRFHLVGHSLGGCIAWGLLGKHAPRIASVTLMAPGPPSGFPGARGLRGELNYSDGAGSGAGVIPAEFAERIRARERDVSNPSFSPRAVMNRAYWKPPFRPAREEQLLTAMLQVHVGDRAFPGDSVTSAHWPGFAPGRFGPINALSPRYNQAVFDQVLAASEKPRLLWIYGRDDAVLSDQSPSDPGVQGKLGGRPDWPGEAVFPPQPILSQVKYALAEYERAGGHVRRLVLAGVGHTPYLEQPAAVLPPLIEYLEGR